MIGTEISYASFCNRRKRLAKNRFRQELVCIEGGDARDLLKLADGEKLLRHAIDDAVEWQPGADEELARRIAAVGLTKVLRGLKR
jgi:hypothetical protein